MHRRDVLRLIAVGGLAAASGCGARRPAVSATSIADLDCIDQNDLIVTGAISKSEAVASALERIDSINDQLNAVITRDDERALERARVATGALAGVPYLLKDLNAYRDMRTTMGSALFRDHVPDSQSPYTDRIDAAGLVVLGKTNTPEFGILPATAPKLHGPTRNPWNTKHTPGGSSGGAAAAVAARMVPAAQASDGGGSIRIPAALCGLFGLKPSAGRFPDQGYRNRAWPISIKHAITRSVRDSALILALTENTEGGPLLPVGFVTPEAPKRLRIAVSTSTHSGPATQDVSTAVLRVAETLRQRGHDIEAVEKTPHHDPDFNRHISALWGHGVFGIVQQVEADSGIDAENTGLLEPATITLARRFAALPGDALQSALDYFSIFQKETADFFDTYDAWLSPVTHSVAPRVGYMDPAMDFDTLTDRVTEFARFTAHHNVAGTPAMSVPAGRSSNGLPIGVQLAAKVGDDALLLQLAYQLEEMNPWAQELPPVHA
ncbi:MAG: amidase family protein [Pseudomonadota bacterium]